MKETKNGQMNQGHSNDQKKKEKKGVLSEVEDTATLEKSKAGNKNSQTQQNEGIQKNQIVKNDRDQQNKENVADKSKKIGFNTANTDQDTKAEAEIPENEKTDADKELETRENPKEVKTPTADK